MNEHVIEKYLCCPACRECQLAIDAFETRDGHAHSAVVTCGKCSTWYRMEDGLLELLVPSLRHAPTDAAFRSRFAKARGAWPYGGPADAEVADEHKMGQKTFYDDDASSYETNLMQLKFWEAFDRGYTRTIEEHASAGGVLIEVGGGSGRQSIPLRNTFDEILSFDISEAMVRRAMRRLGEVPPGRSSVHYFVADAENIPIRSGCADVAVFSGILHHVAAPDQVIVEAARVLRPGGRFVGMENNRTIFRPLFDWLMRVRRLWNEKAHPEHFIISGRELQRWFAGAGVRGTVWTSVFVPPHVFDLLPRFADQLLRVTDGIGQRIPGLRRHGGLVLFKGEKPLATGRASALVASGGLLHPAHRAPS